MNHQRQNRRLLPQRQTERALVKRLHRPIHRPRPLREEDHRHLIPQILPAPQQRPRRLLLHRRQLDRLAGRVKLEGIALVVTKVYFDKNGRLKAEVGLAKGKKQHDKRATEKERDWQRDKARLLRG